MIDELDNFEFEYVEEGILASVCKAKFKYHGKSMEVNFFAAANELANTPAFEQMIRCRCLNVAKDMILKKQAIERTE